jgi:hypothetical protein
VYGATGEVHDTHGLSCLWPDNVPSHIRRGSIRRQHAKRIVGFNAMTMHVLLLQCSDNTLDHPILLRVMRRDELLTGVMVSYHLGTSARRED